VKKLLVVLVVSLFCCMSCGSDDEEPSPGGPSGSPPVISDLQCPRTTLDSGEGGGAATVEDCLVGFFDEDEDLETILQKGLYSDQDCGVDPLPDFPIDVRPQTVGQQQGTILFDARIQTNCVAGTYTYEFVAVDSEDSESNELVLQFVLVDGS